MWQRLDGRGSLATAVQQVVQGALGDLVPPEKRVVEKRVSSHTGALSRARTRLPLEAAEAVCDQVFATLIQSAQAGPAVAVVSGGWLLDAPAAHPSLREGLSARWQSAWGAHWPVIRVLTAHHWSSGLAVRPCWGPMANQRFQNRDCARPLQSVEASQPRPKQDHGGFGYRGRGYARLRSAVGDGGQESGREPEHLFRVCDQTSENVRASFPGDVSIPVRTLHPGGVAAPGNH